jgi:cell division protein FtsX
LITKSSLQAYHPTLDTLQLMGAKSSYIANIFQVNIRKSVAKGGFLGFLLSIPTVYTLVVALQHLGLHGIIWDSVFWPVTIVLLAVPISVFFLSIFVSRLTVLSYLRRLDVYQ